jgi:hypothetical protein
MNKKRKVILATSNRYQEKIILLSFIPSLFILLGLAVALFFARESIIHNVNKGIHVNYPVAFLNWIYESYNYIIFGLCAIFVFSVWVSFKLSHHLLGAFTRIIPELDAIIEGRSQKILSARPGDDFANDLLKRINILVKCYIEHKK